MDKVIRNLATSLRAVSLLLCLTAVFLGALRPGVSSADDFYPYITNTLPLSGYVKKLAISKKKPNVMYALVQNDGPPKPSDKTGLYVFDISDARNPKQISYLSVTSPVGMELNDTRNRLFVSSAYFQGHDPKGWYGISVLDVSNPETIRVVERIEMDAMYARLSTDGAHLFVAERNSFRKSEKNVLFSVFSVSSLGNLKLLTEVKGEHSSVYGFYPIPGGEFLLVSDSAGRFLAYDIAAPSVPRKEFDKLTHLGYPKAMGSDGTLYLLEGDDLILATVLPTSKKIGVLQGRFSGAEIAFVSEDNRYAYLTRIDKTIQVLDLAVKSAPKFGAQYSLPNYIGSVIAVPNSNVIYVGLLESIVVIDPSKAVVTVDRLVAAHAESLKQYARKDLKFDFERVGNAISVLEAAGIRMVLESKPSNLPDKALAGILNDYGFFLTKTNRGKEAIDIYKRVIGLDPSRSVAYLNLGDSLRNQLRAVASFQEKISLTKEIKTAYTQYKQRSGKSMAEVDSFLSFNVVDKPQSDFCEYVASFANQGKLVEIFGSGASVKKADGRSSMRVSIGDQGTAHMPWLQVFDNESGEEITQGASGVPTEEEETRWAENIAVVPYKDGHHLLYYNDGEFLISTTPIGVAQTNGKACRFKTRVIESFDKKAADPVLCQLVKTNRPPYVEAQLFHSLIHESVVAAGYSETGIEKALKVDFDNDGNDDVLVGLYYASGAGRGCDYSFFDLLNARRDGFSTSKDRALLQEMQGTAKEQHMRHNVPSCSGNATGWFRHNGVTYYETKYPGNEPKNGRQEFHRVSYIKDGSIKEVCEASFKLQVTVQH